MVQCHPLDRKRKTIMTYEEWMDIPITFPPVLARDLSEEALVVEAQVEGYLVRRIHIDEGALVKPLGKIELDVCFGGGGRCRRAIMKFTVIPGVATILSQAPVVFECRREGKKQAVKPLENERMQGNISPTMQVLINPAHLEQLVAIGTGLSAKGSSQLKSLLKKNTDIFAWEPSDMTRVPKRIIKTLIEYQSAGKTSQSEEKGILLKEKPLVGEWLKVGIVRPVKYPTWILNPVLVKKVDESCRMCIDFKNISAACTKDYYPLPEIDSKIEAVMGFPLKCFLDAYKGYHQVQMAEEDEEKTTFYTDQGTYCYTKMPGMKRIFKKRNKKKAKNKQNQARDGKVKINPKSKVSYMKKIQLEGLKLPNLKLYCKRKRQGSKLQNWAKFVIRSKGPKLPTYPNFFLPAQNKTQ
ncbi:hypothetical protein Tco_1097116, partial [Tanacetum coccineum]